MGALKDKAKAQSKFLVLEKGESAIVQFVDFKFVPSELDPTVEVALFQFKENGSVKFWKSGSGKIMTALDAANPGDWVKITRGRFIKKDGTEDTNKSQWSAELLVGYKPGQTMDVAAKVAPQASQGPKNDPLEVAGEHLDGHETMVDPFNIG